MDDATHPSAPPAKASTSTATSTSGIPRPASRLPVLNKRPSHSALPRPKQPTPHSTTSTSVRQPALQKRSSIASFSRSTSATAAPAKAAPSSHATAAPTRTAIGASFKQPAPLSNGPRIARRPSSRGNQQRRPPSPRKPACAPEDEENHDQLSSLDSFRSASRQGSQDGSPTDPPEVPPLPAKDRKSSRPSLSDRTIESLQNVPTTPKDRRRSSFFSPIESPMGPPPRPASSLSRNGSDRCSRPGTSDGTFAHSIRGAPSGKPTASSAKPASRTSLGGFGFTPRTSTRLPSASKGGFSEDLDLPPPRSPSPSKRAPSRSRPSDAIPGRVSGSKTVGARPQKPRPALSDAFGPAVRAGKAKADNSDAHRQHSSSGSGAGSSNGVAANPTSSSSSALREQIAAAKAAARKEKAKGVSRDVAAGSMASMDDTLHVDPFNQAPRDEKHILRNRINTARMDGRLNIAALHLRKIPEAVMTMYDAAAMEESKVNWAEVVDLVRLNAADNEIEVLGDEVFPDKSSEDFATDEDSVGNQFGGLEGIDLHGNRLHSLPMGLRRLERLTTLNLSHNRLENGALSAISEVSSLRELKLGHNALSGSLSHSICNLQHLEVLDLQANRLLSLPESLRELVNLKVLNVSGNQLTSLPMDAMQDLGLTELDASSNALIGPLFPPGTLSAHATLQTLKISNNSLAALTFSDTLDLPQLRSLDAANNHLTGLPSISDWTELLSLMCGDNKLSEVPDGFTSLQKLRHVNFASNNIRLVDPEIGKMESLEGLVLASNPLRDKKFLTMSAHDIKRDLRARLEPADADEGEIEPPTGAIDGGVQPSPSAGWTLKGNGVLDLSGKALSDSVNDSLGSFLQSNEVRQIDLSENKLTAVPPALWLAQDLRILNLSGNSLGSDFFSDELELPMLQELKLTRCHITTLEPLFTHLRVPKLHTLDVTANRLSGPVPHLRADLPALTTFLAGDNKFASVDADALAGLHTVNLQSNDLEQLPATIGLLWDEGLKNFEVGSNAFRVPNHRVLEKGTQALMKWLRNRIPGYEEAD